MKASRRYRAATLVSIVLAAVLALPTIARAAIAVEQIVSAKGEGTISTQAFSTASAGELVLAFATSDGPRSRGQTLSVSGAGLAWSLVRRANAQVGSSEIWMATASSPLANATITSTQSTAGYRQALTVVTFAGAVGIGASASASAANGPPGALLMTTQAGSLVFGVGNDPDKAIARTVAAGQTVVNQVVDKKDKATFWVQAGASAIADAGTAVQVADTAPTADRWNLAAVEILAGTQIVTPTGAAIAPNVFADGLGAVTTPPFATTQRNTVLVAFAASDGPASGQSVTVSGAGLSWTLVRRANTQTGTSEIWTATAPTPLAGATVTSTPAVGGFHQSLTLAAFERAIGVGASAAASARTGAPTVSLVTTGLAGSAVYGVGNDGDRAIARTVGPNQAIVHQWVEPESRRDEREDRGRSGARGSPDADDDDRSDENDRRGGRRGRAGDTFWVQAWTNPITSADTPIQLRDTAPTRDEWNFAAVEIMLRPRATPVITVTLSPPPNANGWHNTPVTAHFECSEGGAPLAGCPADQGFENDGSGLTATGTVTDPFGISATVTSDPFNIDRTRPQITADLNPPAVNGWNRSAVTVHFTCTENGSGLTAPCPPDQVFSTDVANQPVTATVTDRADNAASVDAIVRLDTTAPTVHITSPADGVTVIGSSVDVSGTVADTLSGIATVTCNGAPATFSTNTFSCNVALQEGDNEVAVVVTDVAGNTGRDAIDVAVTVPGPAIAFTSPAALTVFNGQQTPITVSGTVDDPNATIVVTSPDAPNGVPAGVSGGTWTTQNVPLKEGHNLLTATATNARGGVSSTNLTVTLDTTPPIIRIDNPPASATLTNGQISVSGVVNDIVPGTVNSEQVTVQVNGLDAQVSNRSFVVPELLLARGQNTLTAVATDRAGNQSQTRIQVTLQDSLQQQRIEIVSGDHQTAPISTTLPEPLVVRLLDAAGAPVANRAVTFRVVKSEGTLTNGDEQVQQRVVMSDEQGNAASTFTLGSRSGVGNNQISASAVGFAGTIIFAESATVGPPAQINIVSGTDQRGAVSQPLPLPFVVIVFDAGGNPVADVPIDFKVLQGGGRLGDVSLSLSQLSIATNGDGKATAELTLGETEGANNQVVAAGFGGDPETLAGNQRVTFQASGLVPGARAETRVSGVVLDNTETPIPNATATIVGSTLQARSDAAGRFTIAGAPVGTITLIVDGSTTTRPERFPFLAFVLNTVAGIDNTVGMPIYIPPLDTANAKLAGGDEDVVLTMDGVPGVAFTIAPHSTTMPDGRHEPVQMMLSQVHADKVPMPPPNGSAPRLVWTLQPAGVHFDPPIRVQLPNTDGLAPGTVLEIFQFDHDLEQFVSTGPGRISPDGSVLVSDPGFGVTKSGWGAPQPPPPPKNCTLQCDDKNVCTSDSVKDPPCACDNAPANEGGKCGGEPGANSCLKDGECSNGICLPSDFSDPYAPCDDGIFCTDPDKCGPGGVLCFGEKIPDKEGPRFTFKAKLGAVEGVFTKIGSLFGAKELKISYEETAEQKNICCEEKQQKDVPVKKVRWGFAADLKSSKLFVPGLSFPFKGAQIGVFVTLGLFGKATLEGENDLCADEGICWKGIISAGGTFALGLGLEVIDSKVLAVSGQCRSGLQFEANVSCKEYQVGAFIQPGVCSFTVEFANGLIAFGVEKQVFGAIPLVGGTKNPLPTF
ncbi:MAG TPA: carboxypeptidase regulatory-like domain-containing protein [Vicinamibacterales bacterium]|nr:carboxypeptidase regulatory-like domain-containing protein [Vicinamibacterales bacterium]